MIRALPYGGYEYEIISSDEILAIAAGSEACYFVVVDLENTGTLKKQDNFHYALNLKKLTKKIFKESKKKIMLHIQRPVEK